MNGLETDIAVGNYFVITRGAEMNPPLGFGFGFSTNNADWSKPRYARDHDGRVYKAKSVSGSLVAAELVHADYFPTHRPKGSVSSLNLGEVEIEVVSPEYVESLLPCDEPEVEPEVEDRVEDPDAGEGEPQDTTEQPALDGATA